MTYQIETLKKTMKLEESIGAGDRIARLIAKTVTDKITKVQSTSIDGRAVSESMAVVLPVVSIGTINAILADDTGKNWIRDQLHGLQDQLVRKAFGAGKNSIFDDQISIGAMLAAMSQEESSKRFSKESIGAWFDSDLSAYLMDAIKNKVSGISDDKLIKLVQGYKEDFQTFAAREVFMSPEMKQKLQKALNLLPDDYESEHSVTAKKLFEKFASAGTKAKVEDVL